MRAQMMVGTALTVPDWAYQLELEIWVVTLRNSVLPEILVRLVDAIDDWRFRSGGQKAFDPGIWRSLAPRETDSGHLRHRLTAEAALIGAYRRHLEKASVPRMRDAVSALRDLCNESLPSTGSYGVAVLSTEGEHLAYALADVILPTVRLLLATAVLEDFESAVKDLPVRQLAGSRATDWYRRYPGLDRWRPVWVAVMDRGWAEPCESLAPNVFVPGDQQTYVAVREDRERDNKGQEGT